MPASKNDVGQFERDHHLETTTRAYLNAKHVEVRIRIGKVMNGEIPETICLRYVGRWRWLGPDVWKSGRGFRHGKLSTIAHKSIGILLDLLQVALAKSYILMH